MEIVTRQAALISGLDKYFTGRPCIRGHVAQRSTRTKICCECALHFARAYYADGRAKEAQKRYRAKNIEKYRALDRNRGQRVRSDPLKRLKSNMRSLINITLRSGGYTKRTRTHEILGCSWEEFYAHIERQFLPGMSWENRHLWHIDHIVPMSTAKTEADVIALNHFTNLRPLWGPDNLKKGAKQTHLI